MCAEGGGSGVGALGAGAGAVIERKKMAMGISGQLWMFASHEIIWTLAHANTRILDAVLVHSLLDPHRPMPPNRVPASITKNCPSMFLSR